MAGAMGDEQGSVVVLDEIEGISSRYAGRTRRRSLAAMRYELEDLSDETLRAISHLMEADLARVQRSMPVEPTPGLGDVVRDAPKGPTLVPEKPGLRKKVKQGKREQALPLLRLLKSRREDRD